ncbi:hypothetical protein L345_13016, partial [Ophiophagus hannah]
MPLLKSDSEGEEEQPTGSGSVAPEVDDPGPSPLHPRACKEERIREKCEWREEDPGPSPLHPRARREERIREKRALIPFMGCSCEDCLKGQTAHGPVLEAKCVLFLSEFICVLASSQLDDKAGFSHLQLVQHPHVSRLHTMPFGNLLTSKVNGGCQICGLRFCEVHPSGVDSEFNSRFPSQACLGINNPKSCFLVAATPIILDLLAGLDGSWVGAPAGFSHLKPFLLFQIPGKPCSNSRAAGLLGLQVSSSLAITSEMLEKAIPSEEAVLLREGEMAGWGSFQILTVIWCLQSGLPRREVVKVAWEGGKWREGRREGGSGREEGKKGGRGREEEKGGREGGRKGLRKEGRREDREGAREKEGRKEGCKGR